jgi:peptide deformylase
MAVKKILKVSTHEKLLRSKSAPVAKINRDMRALFQDMRDTMEDAGNAIGLAAIQIGVPKRVFAVRLGYREVENDDDELVMNPPIMLINPEIVEQEGAEHGSDACLSIPGMMGYTDRAARIRVRYLDEQGQPQDREFSGWDARVILHEYDHLDGILFTDRVATLDDLFVLVREKDGTLTHIPYKDVVQGAARKTGGPKLGASPLPGTSG